MKLKLSSCLLLVLFFSISCQDRHNKNTQEKISNTGGSVEPVSGKALKSMPPENVPDFSARLEPVGRILNMKKEGWIVWGAAPIYGPDGKVHAFVARWKYPAEPVPPDREWARTAQIVHVVAEKPEGPYETREVVVKAREGDHWDNSGILNPQIHFADGQYVLLYIGAKNGELQGQSIGMMTSKSLDGPWKRVSDKEPIIQVSPDENAFDSYLCNNPAFVKSPDGRYFLYYKGRSLADNKNNTVMRRIGVAVSDHLEGPYVKYSGNPILDHSPKDYEDPFVWYEDGKFKMLMHDISVHEHGSGLYFESYDGLHWSEPGRGYPSVREMTGNKEDDRLETPMILFKDGKPDYLYCNRASNTRAYLNDPGKAQYTGFLFKVKEVQE